GVIDTVSMVAEQMSTRIVVHAPSSPVMAVVDRVRITRIVRNLVVNAIEHGEGNPIDIYVSSNAEAVAVSVRDHGVGMNEEQVETSSTGSGVPIRLASAPSADPAWAWRSL